MKTIRVYYDSTPIEIIQEIDQILSDMGYTFEFTETPIDSGFLEIKIIKL